MKTLLRLWLVLLAFVPIIARAQVTNAGASIACDGKLYQIRQVPATNTTHLFQVNRTTTPYTTVDLKDLGLNLNALAYNQQDNFLYALTYSDAVSPRLYKIGANGAQDLGLIKTAAVGGTNLPAVKYASGTIDANGIMYFSAEGGANIIYRLNISNITTLTPTPVATTVSLRNTAGTATSYTLYDLAVNPLDNELYGSFNEGQLYRLVVNTLGTQATVFNISSATAVNGATHPVGTLFFDAAGTLLAASNGTFNGTDEGNFYIIDVASSATSSTWVKVTTLPRSAQSDGASCVNPDQKLDIVKDLVSVALANTNTTVATYTVRYTIKVKNTATETGVNATNIQVNDFLFRTNTGDNPNNITFPTANLPSATAATRSSITSVTVTDDDPAVTITRNTTFNGTSGTNGSTSALLANNQTLNQGRTITIAIEASVRFPVGSVPNTAQLNTALASSSSSANNSGYRVDATSGVLVPPIDLLAADQSTDGATLPTTPNGDTPSPTPVNFGGSIVGTVFEDVNYGGGNGRSQAASNGVAVGGARVELYNANGSYRTFTTTDVDGFYSFGGLTNGTNYTVRVVNSSVKSTREGGATATTTLPVQTYANASKVGGNNPAGVDPGNVTAGNLPAAAQSTVTIAAVAGDPAVVDFGFNFDVIVNTNATGQGSLDQFILNSNALLNDNTDPSTGNDLFQVGQTPGVETSIFMIPASALTNGVAVITPTANLTAITDKFTSIDGTTQTTNIGNSNSDTALGAGGTVGTAATALGTVARPEVQIVGSTVRPIGLDIRSTAIGSVVTGISIYGFGNATDSNANGNIIVAANNTTITGNVIGNSAKNFSTVAPVATNADNIRVTAGTGVQITNNLIGFANGHGIDLAVAGVTGTVISGNEIRSNGGNTSGLDGISIAGSNATVQNNLLINNAGQGVDSNGSNGNNTISGNTISGNGVGNTETAAVCIYGTGSAIRNNIIRNNYGAGVTVTSGANSNTISQNSISGNGTIISNGGVAATNQIGIDLLGTGDDAAKGTNPFVTRNDNGDGDTGANGLLNFPILSTASINATNLVVTGFARPGAIVELFLASADASGFGEGQTYLVTRTEGSAADTDGTTGTYSGTINGLNQGTDNTNRFTFTIPLSGLGDDQRTALLSGDAILTSTATIANVGTSEFSGNLALPIADVTVSITGPTTLYAGQSTGTYTAIFTNEGSAAANSVTRTVTLPTGASLTTTQQNAILAAYPGTTFSGTTITFPAVTSLSVNGTSSVTFAFTAPTTISTTLGLTANTSTTSSEGSNAAPNAATLALTTVNTVDVTASITAAAITANATTGTFNVSYANNGPQQAAGVAYTVQLPAGLSAGTAVTVSNGGTYNNTTGLVTFPVATLNSGSTFASAITYLLSNSATPVTAVARVATTTDEAGRTDNNVDYATLGTAFDLTTTLSGSTSVITGSPTTLFVTTTNNGPNTAATATQTVQLPAGLSQVFVTNGGIYNSGNGLVTFPALSNLPSGQTITSSISFLAPASFASAPVATVSTTSGTETNTANNSASISLTVGGATSTSTNMATAITANQTVVAAGTAVTYTVTATNQGPTAPASVTQRVQLLPGLTTSNLSVTGNTGSLASGIITFGSAATYNVATGVLTYANRTSGNGVTVGTTNTFPTIVVTTPTTVGNDGQLLATASVTSNLSDNVPADNVASVAVKVRTTPDVTTTISGPSSTVAGLPVSYVVQFANAGTTTATTVTEAAQLPAGLTDVTIRDADGNVVTGASYTSATGLVTFPSMTSSASGASQTFVVTFTAPAQTFPVTSTITSLTADGVGSNNSANQLTTVTGNADLAVAISGPETAVVGNPVTYIVTMTNNGPTPATNATATLQLPTGLTGVQVGPTIGANNASYNSTSGLLTFATVPTLTEGGSLVNYVTFTMPNASTGQIIPVATVSTATTDAVASNNTAALTTSIAPATTETADLLTSITPASGSVTAGANASFTVAYRNQAGSTATNVVRTISLPTGLAAATLQVSGVTGTQSGNLVTFNSGPASGATYDVTTGQLTFPTLATLAVSTTATSFTVAFPAPVGSGQLVVVSEIASATSDNVSTNNRANSSLTVNTSYDVTTSLAGPTTATPGTINTYTVTTRNAGPSTGSSSTTQTVTLPSGLTTANLQVDGLTGTGTTTITFTSGGATVATYNAGTGALSFSAVTNLPAGVANAVVHSFSLPMPTTGNLALSAAVTSANDSNTGNNAATLTTTPLNIAPVAQNVWNTLRDARANTANLSAPTGYPISSLNATDVNPGGSIVSYSILSLPTTTQGVLYYNGSPATTAPGLVTDPTKLSFAPASGYVGNATFTYTATDNDGLTAPAALYTIPVAQDISSAYAYTPAKGGASPYQNGNVIAFVTDATGARYMGTGTTAGLVYDATTGALVTGASNGLPETGTNATTTSTGALQLSNLGLVLNPTTGVISVADRTKLATGTYTVPVTTIDVDGGTNTQNVTFTIGVRPLPVTLVAFTAQAAGQDAKLVWSTSQELNNDRFVVERSFDAVTFQAVGEVKGKGTTNAASNYSFVDAKVGYQAQGSVYYRLRQVDTDGTITLSPVQVVRFAQPVALEVTAYPNPATTQATLDLLRLPQGSYPLRVLDATGRVIYQRQAQGQQTLPLPVQNWPTGTYLIQVSTPTQLFTTRLLKQ